MYKKILQIVLIFTCLFVSFTDAAAQTELKKQMKLGTYYFAGWAGKTSFDDGTPENAWAKGMPTHISKKLVFDYAGRTPLWGWRDDTPEIMEKQIDLAADHGISFFSFCWYWSNNKGPINIEKIENDPKHQPMKIFMQAKNNAKMEFCLLVANHQGSEIVGEEAWKQAADYWLTLFKHPRYLKVDGKPVIVIFAPNGGNEAGFAYMQDIARKAGFPGVEISCCGNGDPKTYTLRTHYCLRPGYGKPSEEHPYEEMVEAHVSQWKGTPEQPYMPVATVGWDRRPWETPDGLPWKVETSWYFKGKTPEAFESFLQKMLQWMNDNPQQATKDRLAMIYAWNEIGEGGYLIPCREDPDGAYLKAIKRVVFGENNNGEFTHRMNMTRERLTGTKFNPVFTPEFILADVNISRENPRRFDNYSGDISGRYIEALSISCPHDNCSHLDNLVSQTLNYQHPDGRFGNPDLVFTKQHIGKDHMPLLWGNGRLLTGLLEYHKHTRNKQVLETARKLGDFFLSTYQEVTPEVSKRLDGRGADGIICFTQYVEPLVMLSVATGDPKYAQAAAKVYPTLPERTTLHTHGYLTTMRGVLQLFEYDKNRRHFDYVEKAYADLVASDDFTIFGSVKEYFGSNTRGGRDEGCSTADFIRLSLHLYKITGKIDYLERAEFAIINALYYNQYFTGDFGSHAVNRFSSRTDGINAAWWCCTMAGLKAMQVVHDDYFAESNRDGVKINLYLETSYSDDRISFTMSKGRMQGDFHAYDIIFDKMNEPVSSFSIRQPSWADNTEIYLNDKKIETQLRNGYLVTAQKLTAGDRLQIRTKFQTRIITADNKTVKLNEVQKPVNGVLCYGPYLMGIDTKLDYVFSSEPNNNTVFVGTVANGTGNHALAGITANSFVGDVYLTANYQHGGFPSYYQTVFRPVSELTFQHHPFMMITTTFASELDERFKHVDKKAFVPWKAL